VPGEDEATGPRIPLVGRRKAYARLRQSWEMVRQGMGRLLLVEGEAGIGKTRLIETFIRDVESQTSVMVLRGSCHPLVPSHAYRPIAEALREAIRGRSHLVRAVLETLPTSRQARLTQLVPDLRAVWPDLPKDERWSGSGQQIFDACADFFRDLSASLDAQTPAERLILFLDDWHWADRASLELLRYLMGRLVDYPIWVIVAYQPQAIDGRHPLASIWQQIQRDPYLDRVVLERLNTQAIDEIAQAVLEGDGSRELADFLSRESAGLPLTIREMVNTLIDQEILVSDKEDHWMMAGPFHLGHEDGADQPKGLILQRVSHLPASARRLLTLAAVVGPQFDAELLKEADGEHIAVVDAGLEVLYERRLIRLVPWQWTAGIRGTGKNGHGSNERVQIFEFAHEEIRLALYQDVNPARRRIMHRQVAQVLERRYGNAPEQVYEALAHHYAMAEDWQKAVGYLRLAGEKAWKLLAGDVALHYYAQALAALDTLQNEAGSEAEEQPWRTERRLVLVMCKHIAEQANQANNQLMNPESLPHFDNVVFALE
jgi:predicted ATPase